MRSRSLHLKNQQDYLDWLMVQLGMKGMDDLYQLRRSSIEENKGFWMLQKYGGSVYSAVSTIYPNHQWLEWKFSSLRPSFWNERDNQRRFLQWVMKEKKLCSPKELASASRLLF
jgi:hypothetical protein